MCKYFINSRICFQWILLHEVLFFGFESLGRTGCQYVCHINYSWLDNRNATSWKNNKINSKPNFRYHRKLFVCLFVCFSDIPKNKQANDTASSITPQPTVLWLSQFSGIGQSKLKTPSKGMLPPELSLSIVWRLAQLCAPASPEK